MYSFDLIYVQVDLIYLTLDHIYQILTIYLKTDFCPIWRVISCFVECGSARDADYSVFQRLVLTQPRFILGDKHHQNSTPRASQSFNYGSFLRGFWLWK